MEADGSALAEGAQSALRERYVQALVEADLAGARGLVEEAVASGTSVQAVYLDVLQPALYEIGRRWAEAEVSVAQEHLATAVTETLMARLSERMGGDGRPRRGRTAVIACAEGELHAVGARMVGDFLDADGWSVEFLGAITPPVQLARYVAERGAEVVAVSAALPERTTQVTAAVRALGMLERRPCVVVGGQAFGGSEARALRTGADLYAPDAAAAVTLLGDRFPVAA